MKEFFSVISYMSPITIILILSVSAIFIALLVSKSVFGKARKILGSAAFLLLIYFLIIGQELIGSTYHEYLCETQAGWKNYSKIKLPAEYWNEDGSPTFVDEDGKIQHKKINEWFVTKSINEKYIDSLFRVDKKILIYKDKNTNKIIGEKINFLRYFGWIKEYSLAPNVGRLCDSVYANKYGWGKYHELDKKSYQTFIRNLFKY